MKRQGLALAVVLAVVPLLAFAETSAPSQGQNEPLPKPTIEIVHPTANEKFSDYPIHVETKVTNFLLEPPVQYWGNVERSFAGLGHIHYTLDDSPIFATNRTHVTITKPPGKSLPVGKHILRAELVYVNHGSMQPRVFAEIPILCERQEQASTSKDGGLALDTRAHKDMQEVERQLKEVQKELSDLNEHAHDAPNP